MLRAQPTLVKNYYRAAQFSRMFFWSIFWSRKEKEQLRDVNQMVIDLFHRIDLAQCFSLFFFFLFVVWPFFFVYLGTVVATCFELLCSMGNVHTTSQNVHPRKLCVIFFSVSESVWIRIVSLVRSDFDSPFLFELSVTRRL